MIADSRSKKINKNETCSSDEERIVKFEDWIQSYKLSVNKLSVRSIPGYRMGTVAKQPIRKGEIYISVPEELMIGPERYQSGTPFDSLLNLVQKNTTADLTRVLDSKSLLLIFILLEKHMVPDSIWRPYFDLLPQNLTLPMFFTNKQLQALQVRRPTLCMTTISAHQAAQLVHHAVMIVQERSGRRWPSEPAADSAIFPAQ
jgi:hypothetical protein